MAVLTYYDSAPTGTHEGSSLTMTLWRNRDNLSATTRLSALLLWQTFLWRGQVGSTTP
jgi:hypothetical protein